MVQLREPAKVKSNVQISALDMADFVARPTVVHHQKTMNAWSVAYRFGFL